MIAQNYSVGLIKAFPCISFYILIFVCFPRILVRKVHNNICTVHPVVSAKEYAHFAAGDVPHWPYRQLRLFNPLSHGSFHVNHFHGGIGHIGKNGDD